MKFSQKENFKILSNAPLTGIIKNETVFILKHVSVGWPWIDWLFPSHFQDAWYGDTCIEKKIICIIVLFAAWEYEKFKK